MTRIPLADTVEPRHEFAISTEVGLLEISGRTLYQAREQALHDVHQALGRPATRPITEGHVRHRPDCITCRLQKLGWQPGV